MFDLNERKILVTGASGSIGRAIALAYHKQGATVALSGRQTEKLEAVAHEMGNVRVHIVLCDLSNDEEVGTLIPRTMEILGGIDTLVNNAGITRDGLTFTMKLPDWQEVLRVNLEVAFRLSQAALKPMLKERFGRLINIASVVGVTGNPGQPNYCAAKAGLIGFSKALAKEVASRNITVNCIAPGFIESPMTTSLTEEQQSKISATIPGGKMGTPEDIAAAAIYFASKEASYITGQTLHVNGGMVMI
jgi:3-oxoacyl-[acyl-carrier protein] reductase